MEREVDNLQEICESDAYITFFVNGYIGRSIGHRRKCAACKDILLVDRDNEIFLSDYVPRDYIKLFSMMLIANHLQCQRNFALL